MNDTSRELPSPVELPAPVTGANTSAGEQLASASFEQGTHEKKPLSPTGNGGGNSASTTSQPQALSSADDHTTQARQLAGSTPQIADDADLIEKEWVEKAKEIVEKTRENPYLQNKAINEIKADYIKKRYNKEVTNTDTAS